MKLFNRKGTAMKKEASSKTVMVLSGKAKQVFRYMELAAEYKGKKTLKELP